MKKRWVLPLLVLTLFLCLLQSPAHGEAWPASREGADSLAELHTIVPEGVTEIHLRTILGDDVQRVGDAWMLRENVYVLLLWSTEEDQADEIILLDTQNGSLLSRTPVPYLDAPCPVRFYPAWLDKR